MFLYVTTSILEVYILRIQSLHYTCRFTSYNLNTFIVDGLKITIEKARMLQTTACSKRFQVLSQKGENVY